MASICKHIVTKARTDDVWSAIRDIGGRRPKRTLSLSFLSNVSRVNLGRLVETFHAARYLRLDRGCHIRSHFSG
jgi:hypothetical protein